MTPPTPGTAPRGARPAVFLHVGAAKSGTTYLQNVLWHNRDRLREHGVLYPGDDAAAHVRAAFDLRGTFFPGASDPETQGAWRDLVDRARDWRGTVIISQELFAPARARWVRRAMADLDFADVHVVFTARDLARQIPAHWQEDVKNRFATPFGDFVTALRRPNWRSFEVARLFWGLQDPVAVLERWGAGLPPDRVHVVTLPRPGAPRDLLWQRFCAAVGLAPGDYDLAAPFDNPSLGLAETQYLLHLNQALDGRVGWHVHNRAVKLSLAQGVLARRPSPVRTVLPAEHLGWATERSVRTVEGLRAAGYHVVGDLYELIPMAGAGTAPWLPPAPDPDEPSWPDLADVGTDAIAALLPRVRAAEERAGRVDGGRVPSAERIAVLAPELAALRERTGRFADAADPVAVRAARTVQERYPAARRLEGAYRRIEAGAGRLPARGDRSGTDPDGR